MDNLIKLLLASQASLAKLLGFVGKEFFLLFVYGIIATLCAGVMWLLIYYAIPHARIYDPLLRELGGSQPLLIAFLLGLSAGAIYFFRLMKAMAEGALL